jgi:hypothetical protein
VIDNLNGATSNVQSTGAFGLVDGTAIVAELQLQVLIYLSTLVSLGVEVESWSAIHGGTALILKELQGADAAMSNFLNAVVAAELLIQKAGAIAIKTQIDDAFTATIAAYSA